MASSNSENLIYPSGHEQALDSVRHLRRPSVESSGARKSPASMSRVSLAESTNIMMPPPSPGVPPTLPEPLFEDSPLSLEQIIADSKFSFGEGEQDAFDEKKQSSVEKRASNVLRLAQENDKLSAELEALRERLRAAEERTKKLEEQKQAGQQSGEAENSGSASG